MSKPKNSSTQPGRDLCQTPPYALDPVIPLIKENHYSVVWEPAEGEGMIVNVLKENGLRVISSDISYGYTRRDFFESFGYPWGCSMQVTNPPFSKKYEWLKHSCELCGNDPIYGFALLMPGDVLFSAKGQELIWKYDIEIILMTPRVNFKMPNKGWGGQAQFSSAWFTRGLNIGERITRVKLDLSWEKQFKVKKKEGEKEIESA